MAEITGRGTRRKSIAAGNITSAGWRIDWKGNRIYRLCITDIDAAGIPGETFHIELSAEEKAQVLKSWDSIVAEGV